MKPNNKTFIICLISLALILSLSFTVYSFIHEISRPKLPVLAQVYDFSLIDSFGKNFNLSRLRGRVWIADFFFTTCGDICPIMTKNFGKLQRTFEKVKDAALVSITVNPEFDSAQVLSEYAKKQEAKENQWYFLTGSREVIKNLAVKSFKLGSIDEPVFHSSYFSLVDKNGLIRGYYDGTKQEDLNRLFKDTAFLLKE